MPAVNHSLPLLPGMEEHWAQVSGGRLRYLIGGSGPPLVLVHGIAASSFSFRLNCAELMSHFRLYLIDLMSPACLSNGRVGTSLAAIGRRIHEFLDRATLEKAHVLGSSHGGAVVMELAAMAPERFQKMVLVSPPNPFALQYRKVVNFYLSPIGRVFMRIAPHMPGRAWDYGIGRMYADPRNIAQGTGDGYARALRTRGTFAYLMGCLKTFPEDVEGLRAKFPVLSEIPTLLIWGDRDPVVEMASAYPLQEALHAELAVMQNVGHLPYEEDPVDFNRVVIRYLQRPGT